jgi:hypothetical protein
MCNFRVGQKVVRKYHSVSHGSPYLAGRSRVAPKEGEIVTIKTINVWPIETLLTFVEYDNSHLTTSGFEPGFPARCFAPVHAHNTSIEIFEKIRDGQHNGFINGDDIERERFKKLERV